jgi:hypothetical protein
MKIVAGTSKLLKRLITTNETYPDQTRVRFTNNLQMFSSADPDWDKAKVFGVRYSINPTRDGDPYNGCLAITMGILTMVALPSLIIMEIKRLSSMKDHGSGLYQKMELAGFLKVKANLLEAQANLRGSVEPLRLKWREEVQTIMYQVSGKSSMK